MTKGIVMAMICTFFDAMCFQCASVLAYNCNVVHHADQGKKKKILELTYTVHTCTLQIDTVAVLESQCNTITGVYPKSVLWITSSSLYNLT